MQWPFWWPSTQADPAAGQIPPCLALILLLFAGCLLHPAAAGYGTPTAAYTALPAVQGILDGYQTMDTLAGLNFGAVIALNIQALGVTEPREVERGTIRAGFLAAGLFAVVYAMLTHIGGIAGAAFPGCETGAETLTLLANALFGRVGQVLLAAIFIIACFNTCVGLISGVSEYFHQLWPKVPYTGWAAFFALTSMLLSNIGLASILELSVPILNAIYPAAIVLIFLSFLPGRFQRCSVYSWAIGLAALQSIPAALPLGPVAALANNLPLGALGFGWLLPAAVVKGNRLPEILKKLHGITAAFFINQLLLLEQLDLMLHCEVVGLNQQLSSGSLPPTAAGEAS